MRYPLDDKGCIGTPQHPRIPVSTIGKLLAEAPVRASAVSLNTPAIEAVRTMVRQAGDALLVMDGDRVAGIFSAHEFSHAMADGVSDQSPVGTLMTICTAHAGPDDTVDQCLERMEAGGLRFLPVLDGDKVVGMLTLESLLRETVDHHAKVYEASELDHRIMFLRGTYSC